MDKLLPEDMFDLIDDLVTNLMADEAQPVKRESTAEETKEPSVEVIEESDYSDDIPELE